MSVATNHVGGLQQNTSHRVVNTTALTGDFRLRANHTLLSVVNEGDTFGDTVRNNRTTHKDTISVHTLNPFAILDTNLLGVLGLIHAAGPPRNMLSMYWLSKYCEWIAHLLCGVR